MGNNDILLSLAHCLISISNKGIINHDFCYFEILDALAEFDGL